MWSCVPRTLLYVFARAPEPGRVKTRLIPAVGAAGAARLHEAFVDDVCARTRGAAARRVLSVAGDPAHPALVALAAREGMAIEPQGEGDLGARMRGAIEAGLAGGAERVAIVGGDVPLLPPAGVRAAFDALAQNDVVLAPAADGGYWLVGARRLVPSIFEGMAWGTASVFRESEARLRADGIRFAVGAEAWDVDEPADLRRLAAALEGDPAAAPATRRALASLGILSV